MENHEEQIKEERKHNLKDPKGVIDTVLARLVSRKLLVWATATTGLFMQIIPAPEWVEICLLYIGSQALVDIVSVYTRARR